MKITLLGMEQYLNPEDSLFKDIALPTSDLLDKDVLVDTILLECGEFEPLYADPNFMKLATNHFFLEHGRTFNKWTEALEIEYAPLENYDRIEDETFDDDIAEIHTRHEGTRLTSESGGTIRDTVNNGKTTSTSTLHEGTRLTSTNDGKVTDTTTIHEGTKRTTTNDGSTTDTTNSGTIQKTTTRPDSSSDIASYAGFSSSGNDLNPGTSNVHKVGSGNTGSYTETETDAQTIAGSVTHTQTVAGTVDTGHIQGENDTNTLVHEQNTAGTSESGHKPNENDTNTVVNEQNTPGTNTREMLTPHNIESGHKTDEEDTDTFVRNPRHLRAHGNIGVTTSQQMLKSELDIALFNIYKEISKLYMTELTLPIYW